MLCCVSAFDDLRPRNRDLSEPELLTFARELAAQPARWRHLVAHDPDHRRYEELLRDAHVAAWLICWTNEQDTGFHDHDLSAGAVAVAAGCVREERLVLGGPTRSRRFSAGQAFSFSAADIHRVQHEAGTAAVTIHAYSPPLWRMGAYEIGGDGSLRRHPLSYADELRPVVPVPA
jgi:predicted metal-dependent enzyme (double-stranded beta helix superfamily)